MSDKRLVAAFFIPAGLAPVSLEDLVSPLLSGEAHADRDGHYGCWGGFEGTLFKKDELSHHFCLQARFWASSFFETLTDSDDDSLPLCADGAWPLFAAFHQACRILQPDFAVVHTRGYDCEEDWLYDRYKSSWRSNPRELLDPWSGLVFLKSSLAKAADRLMPLDKRDWLEDDNGLFTFAGRGWGRWF